MASEALKNIGTHVLLQLRIIEFDRLPNNVQPLLKAIKAAAMPISLDQVKETYNNKNYYGGKELTFHDLNPFFLRQTSKQQHHQQHYCQKKKLLNFSLPQEQLLVQVVVLLCS